MSKPVRPSDEDVHAFIDGELGGNLYAEITGAIQEDAELARKLGAYRADKARLAQVYGPLIDRPLPAEWLTRIQAHRFSRPPAISRRAVFAVAASVAAIAGGLATYRRLSVGADDTLIADAVSAYEDTHATPTSVDAAGRAMSEIVGVALKAPDLGKMGYALAGLRVYDGSRKAVKLDYRDHQGRLFTLYVTPSSGEPHFDMTKRGAVRLCVWQDDVVGAVMLGEMSAGQMLRLASLAYSGLSA